MYVKVVCSHQKIQPAGKTDTISFKIKKGGLSWTQIIQKSK